MKKRRSMVYVQPGKDVTVYVPADTPPEVIEYLNQLKAEGTFSQGVVEIITEYVQRHKYEGQSAPSTWDDSAPFSQESSLGSSNGVPSVAAGALGPGRTEVASLNRIHPALDADGPQLSGAEDPDAPPLDAQPTALPAASPEPSPLRKLNLAQIFQQAKRNSGKLTE